MSSENRNAYKVKAALRPEWYKHGTVQVFSAENIRDWTTSPEGIACLNKMEEQSKQDPEETKFLDTLKFEQSEMEFRELLSGVKDGE